MNIKQQTLSEPELDYFVDEYLDVDEVFLLGFLQGFNRQSNQAMDQFEFEE